MLSHSPPAAAAAVSFGMPINSGLGPAPSNWAVVLSPDPTDIFLNPKVYPPAVQGMQKELCHWMVLGFAGSCLTSAIALGAYAHLIQAPQANLDCDAAATLISGRQRLSCAQQVASSGDLSDVLTALQLTRHWSVHHPLYTEAEPLFSRWSETVLRSAQSKYDDQGQAEARWLVAQIPPHSSGYDQARQLLHDWRQDYYRQGMVLYGQAQQALQGQDWVGAIRIFHVMEALEGNHPELGLAKALMAQIQVERHAQHQLSTGIQLASSDTAAGLEAGINHLNQIDHHTYAWQTAQPLLNDWSDRLLAQGLSHWYDSELNTAAHLGAQVVANPERTQAAQDLIWLSQSRRLVLKSIEASPTNLAKTVGLYPALLIARQITPESRFHPQAAAMLPTWQGHFQNVSPPAVAAPLPPEASSAMPSAPPKTLDPSGFQTAPFTSPNRPQPDFNPDPFITPRQSF